MSAGAEPEVESPGAVQDAPGESPPSELESAFLTTALFGGLVVFGAGCFLMGGFG